MPLIWLLAGEASGDALGARLMAAIARIEPAATFAGVGGPLMAARGLRSLFPMRSLSLMGFAEILPHLPHLHHLLGVAVHDIAVRRPAVIVTIDSPGFAFRLLRTIRPLAIPRAHYVAPQVWAWREGRVKKYPGLWDRLLCLLPFEPAFFHRHRLPATFVGHPVLESGLDRGSGTRFRAGHGIRSDDPLVLTMVGSRPSEIARLGGVFGQALARLQATFPSVRPITPVAPGAAGELGRALAGWPVAPILVEAAEAKADAFAAANAALCKSGTSALELALARVPMVIAYRANPLSAALARRLVKVRYASLINILADREVVPELLQEHCTAERIAAQLGRLLADPEVARRQCAEFPGLLRSLAPSAGSPSDAAAHAVLELVS